MTDDLVKRIRAWDPMADGHPVYPDDLMNEAADRIETLEQASFFADIRLAGMTAAAAESDWRPIETAPRDGTIILLWVKGDREVYAGGYDPNAPMPWRFLDDIRWDADEDHEAGDDPFNAWMPKHGPTHWMPLPAPPEDGK